MGYCHHHVFISHSKADEEWVENHLLPYLQDAGLHVLGRHALPAGAPKLENAEYAIKNSYRTIAVITPEWLENEWNAFESLLIRSSDPAARQRKLLPLLLKKTDLPDFLSSLDSVDITVEKRLEKGLQRLVRDISDVIYVPLPSIKNNTWSLNNWKKWLRRYRKRIRLVFFLSFLFWLAISMLLEIALFQPREGWKALSPKLANARMVHQVNSTYLVSTYTDYNGCHSSEEKGLWVSEGSLTSWLKRGSSSFCFDKGRSHITDVASLREQSQDAPVFVTTHNTGLLQGSDSLTSWKRIGEAVLPSTLENVVVMPNTPNIIFTSRDTEFYQSQDDGKTWEKLDLQSSLCKSDKSKEKLPKGFQIGEMLATTQGLFVGSTTSFNSGYPSMTDGIYLSADNGKCWKKVVDANNKYIYKQLILLPNRKNELLIHTKNLAAANGEKSHQVWKYSPKTGDITSLWKGDSVTSIYANESHWYAVNANGSVTRGDIDNFSHIETLPRITQCLVLGCFPRFLNTESSSVPILLANDHVYRLEQVSWFNRLLP